MVLRIASLSPTMQSSNIYHDPRKTRCQVGAANYYQVDKHREPLLRLMRGLDVFTNQEFIRYLKISAPELYKPINACEWQFYQIRAEGSGSLEALVYHFSLYFAFVDRHLSVEEAILLDDILEAFWSDQRSSRHRDIPGLLNLYQSHFDRDPERFASLEIPEEVEWLKSYDANYGTAYEIKLKAMLVQIANVVIKADGVVSERENAALNELKLKLYGENDAPAALQRLESVQKTDIIHNITIKPQSLDELLEELDSLIGLDKVKSDVSQLVNFLKVQQIRRAKGFDLQPVSRHLVFYGNPGTGKTTIARLLAQIYQSLGILSKGHTVETDRSGLVAGYIGQTALKTREVIDSALGGVLFIDEAYALNSGSGQDFGHEAIDTLLKAMEDNRADFIVIVAGYTDKMSSFLSSNPGFRSRFNKYLSFEDYSPAQLVEIYNMFCKSAGYYADDYASDQLLQLFSALHEARNETFGNARLARNVFEMTINNQANRIVTLTNITEDNLSAINTVDIPSLAALQSIH